MQLADNRDQPAVTADGVQLELLANINNVADARAAVAMGASGVGLFRTEYLYLTHPDVPDEEEQLAAYREIIAASPEHSVTIRTLDIGGDKTVPYLGHHAPGSQSVHGLAEHSPVVRASRVLQHAIPRRSCGPRRYAQAKRGGQVQLMFPMITTLEEMHRLRSAWSAGPASNCKREGKPYGAVPIGMMLEVPAAADLDRRHAAASSTSSRSARTIWCST